MVICGYKYSAVISRYLKDVDGDLWVDHVYLKTMWPYPIAIIRVGANPQQAD